MTNALWYLARGTGVVTLVMLTVVLALGIATRSGRPVLGLPRFAVAIVHRNASLLAVLLLGIHLGTLLLDPYAQLKLVNLVLPFTSSYRPVWVGLGALGLDLIVALVLTSLLRHRLGLRAWRAVHWLAYVCWPIALAHGLGAGTDRGTWWLWTIAVGCAAVVVAALAARLSDRFTETAQLRTRALRAPIAAPASRLERAR
jgi:methionine sulfoxide reductase heme-binding subunit